MSDEQPTLGPPPPVILPPPGIEVYKAEVVGDNPVLDAAQKLVRKRRNDKNLLTRIALTVMLCVGIVGGAATITIAFISDRPHFGLVSLTGVGSFLILLWVVLIAVIWLSDE